jgi:hypothetical protein
VDVRIRPEPDDRDAVLAAVQALLARDRVPAAYRSGWREAGIRENLGYEQGQGETGRPRSTPGAMRA